MVIGNDPGVLFLCAMPCATESSVNLMQLLNWGNILPAKPSTKSISCHASDVPWYPNIISN